MDYKKLKYETIDNNSFRAKIEDKTVAYAVRRPIQENELNALLAWMPERVCPGDTDAYRAYRKALRDRIVYKLDNIGMVICNVIDKEMADFTKLCRIKDKTGFEYLYIVTNKYNPKSQQYELTCKYFPWNDNLYREFKLFDSTETWSHYDNQHTYYSKWIPDCWLSRDEQKNKNIF